jgi:hypothetical protein
MMDRVTSKNGVDDPYGPLARPDELNAADYPHLCNLSAGMLTWQFIPVPRQPPSPPEYVHIPLAPDFPMGDEAALKKFLLVTRWNAAWEAGPMRLGMFDEEEVPEDLRWLEDHEGSDIRLVPDGNAHPYAAYTPLFHLLPLATLKRFGLPPLNRGLWPTTSAPWDLQKRKALPGDFRERLSSAVAYHLWPHLNSERPSSFGKTEPITLLANSLDYWLPYLDIVAQERMKALGRVPPNEEEQQFLDNVRAKNDPRFVPEMPLYGGDVWRGEEDVKEVTQDLVECADRFGKLRAIIDAVKSHRIEDDFSDRWSWAKEDLERKLYRKRSKVKVTLVELHDTIPVHGPDAELHAEQLWQDLMALCDKRERRVVVCLRSGTTRVGDIARELGYANHSPVSKALDEIRRKTKRLLLLD